MIDQRPQDRGGSGSAEGTDECPVVLAGLPLPAAVTGGDAGGIVEQVRSLGQHESPRSVTCASPVIATLLLSRAVSRLPRVNSMTWGVMVVRIQRVAPRCTPDACNPRGGVPRTGTFQISWAYSRMVRSGAER